MTSSNNQTYWPKNRYLEVYNRSIEDPEGFWAEEARKLDWFKTWDKVLEWNEPFSKWFVGGELNASYLCVDRHAKRSETQQGRLLLRGRARRHAQPSPTPSSTARSTRLPPCSRSWASARATRSASTCR